MSTPPPHPAVAPLAAAQRTPGGWWRPGSPLGDWLAACLFVAVPFVAANIATKLLLSDPAFRDLGNLIKTAVLVAAYAAYVRWWERRPVRELSGAGAARELAAGVLLGGLLFAGVMALLAALGAYAVESAGSWAALGAVAAAMLPKIAAGALIEELVFRLLLLRLLQRSVGTAWALGLSSLAFGMAHMGNAGATPLICAMLGLELGLLFGAAYLLTQRLWLCTGGHLGWNFAQGAIFSIAVSGQTGEGWLRGSLHGPAWLTGGTFGVEGSIVALLPCLAATAGLLALAQRRGRFRRAAPR